MRKLRLRKEKRPPRVTQQERQEARARIVAP
jgi:hypothetical protein